MSQNAKKQESQIAAAAVNTVADALDDAVGDAAVLFTAIRDLSERSILQAGDSLNKVSSLSRAHVRDLVALSAEFAGEIDDDPSNQGFGAAVDNLSKLVSDLPPLLDSLVAEVETQSVRQTDLTGRAAEATTEIQQLVSTVTHVALKGKVLSINALIQAAQAGEAGKSFAVVAKGMEELYADVERANVAVARISESLGDQLPALATQAETLVETCRSQSHEIDRIVQDTRTVNKTFARTRDALTDTLAHINAVGEEIRDHCNRAVTYLQFQDRIAQMVDRLESHYSGLATAVRQVAALLEDHGDAVDLQEARALLETRLKEGTDHLREVGNEDDDDAGEISFL